MKTSKQKDTVDTLLKELEVVDASAARRARAAIRKRPRRTRKSSTIREEIERMSSSQRKELERRLARMEKRAGIPTPTKKRQRREEKFEMDAAMGRTRFDGIRQTETTLELGCEISADTPRQQKAEHRRSRLPKKQREEMRRAMGLSKAKLGVAERGNELLLGVEGGE